MRWLPENWLLSYWGLYMRRRKKLVKYFVSGIACWIDRIQSRIPSLRTVVGCIFYHMYSIFCFHSPLGTACSNPFSGCKLFL